MRNLFCVAMLLCTTMGFAQSRTSETIEVSIVNVDVVVTDKKGNRVTGLTADDFEIREGGKLQTITNFTEYRSGMSEGEAGVEAGQPVSATPAPRARRNVVIFVESVRLLPHQAKEMFGGIRKLLRETIQAGDRATVITWRGTVLVRQPFTDDLAALDRVIAELETEAVRGPRDRSAEVRRDQAESDANEAEFTAAGGGSLAGMPQVHALTAARQQLYQIKQKTHLLEAIMQNISGLDGRKILVMAMRRFGTFAGIEFFSGGEIAIEQRRELETVAFRDRLIRTANAHGITLYPVYPAGLRWDPEDVSTRALETDLGNAALENKIMFNETNALIDLAEKTGGAAAWGSANIASLLPTVAGDLNSYYSLGYRAGISGKDVSRGIAVKTKNPDYRVRARQQFVEKSDQTLMNDRVLANLYQRLEGASFNFDVMFGPMKRDGRKRWTLPMKMRIPIAALTALPHGPNEAGEFTVYVVTGGVVGVTSEVQRRTQPFRIPRADLAKAKTSHFTYSLTLEIDDKVDRISVGVLDETSKEFGLKRLAVPPRPDADRAP